MAKRKTEKEENLSFLEKTPPPIAVRALSTLILILFAGALLASIFVEVPESVSGSFVLIPVKGTDPVRVSDRGYIGEVKISEGDVVKAGETLFVVNSESVGIRTADFQTSKTTVNSAEERLTSLRAKYENQKKSDNEEQRKLTAKLEEYKKMLELRKEQLTVGTDIVNTYIKLNEEGISSRVDINRRKMELNEINLSLKETEAEIADTQSALSKQQFSAKQRDAEFREAEQSLMDERDKGAIKMNALKKELTYSEGNQLFVPAPCSGVVVRLLVKSSGAVVEDGEVLCDLACSDRQLQAEVTVPELGLARIQAGQGVKLLYDAFPYQYYGVKFGTVAWVSPASVDTAGKEAFPVRVRLQDEQIQVKGNTRRLLPGMRGRAEIVVDHRRLISYAFAPLRQLQESMAAPPSSDKH